MAFKYNSPTKQEEEAQASLRTFCNYVEAWCRLTPEMEHLRELQEQLNAFRCLQGGGNVDDFGGHFLRGNLILRTMAELPLDRMPDLATGAIYWAPVQAYYALHAFGLSVLSAIRHSTPNSHYTHSSYRRTMSEKILGVLFPRPFNVFCSGDPYENSDCTLENLSTRADSVSSFSHLSCPNQENLDLLIGKSLIGTRKYFLVERYKEERKNLRKNGKKNLNKQIKKDIAIRHPKTSIIDFFYRLRLRSNYEDPDMYIHGRLSEECSISHYNNLVQIVRSFSLLCQNIVQKKVGKTKFDLLMQK